MIGTSDHKQYDNEISYLIGNHTEVEPPTSVPMDRIPDPSVDSFDQRWGPYPSGSQVKDFLLNILERKSKPKPDMYQGPHMAPFLDNYMML